MTLEPQDKRHLSDVRMSKALEFLEDARAKLIDGVRRRLLSQG